MLKVSGEFATVEDHSNYLQCVYETLLAINEIPIESLQQCAAEAVAAEEGDSVSRVRALTSSEEHRERIHKEATLARNKIAYGQHRFRSNNTSVSSSSSSGSVITASRALESEEQPTFADILVEPTPKVDCESDVAYNLVMTSSYMMLAPRSAKSFNGVVTVNSFGYLGFMMASSKQKLEVIRYVDSALAILLCLTMVPCLRSEGPLAVLKGVSQPKKYHSYHDLHQHTAH